MKRTIGLILLALFMTSLAGYAAVPNTWEVKVRAAYLDTANKSDPFTALGIDFPKNSVRVESKWIPELDTFGRRLHF